MSSLAERLRGVIRTGGSGELGSADADISQRRPVSGAQEWPGAEDPAEMLGGEWREARGHRFLVIDRKYSPGYRHGRLAVADTLPPFEGPWPRLSLLAGAACRGRMLFVDLETTGLAGGAGTYAFLVGCGWFDGGVFRTRQFVLTHFGAEAALLDAVG